MLIVYYQFYGMVFYGAMLRLNEEIRIEQS